MSMYNFQSDLISSVAEEYIHTTKIPQVKISTWRFYVAIGLIKIPPQETKE